jgi:DNA-binding NarL/FixJ family response regulator
MTAAIRVLVVDEDPDVRSLTTTFIERADETIEAEAVGGGEAAIERLAGNSFDAVVSDLRMPGMDGLELAAAVRDRHPDLPFVLFSAADDPATESAVDEADVDAFVLKGSGTDHYEEIVAAIHDALDR